MQAHVEPGRIDGRAALAHERPACVKRTMVRLTPAARRFAPPNIVKRGRFL